MSRLESREPAAAAAPPDTVAPPTVVPPPTAAGTRTLLYVEDQDLNLRLVERILQPHLGYRLLTLAVGYLFAAGVAATAVYLSPSMLELVAPVLGITLTVQAIYFIRYSEKARA